MRWLALLVVAACSKSAALPPEGWDVADYVKAGVPDPGHPWSTPELVTASAIIAREAADHPERLPRFQGTRSGAVFARLIERGPRADLGAPIAPQFKEYMDRIGALDALSKLYGLGSSAMPTRSAIEIAGVTLDAAAQITPLAKMFLAGHDLDGDAQSAARHRGMQQMLEGEGQMVTSSLAIVGLRGEPLEDRRAMLVHLSAILPKLFPDLLLDDERQIRAELHELVDATDDPLHDDLVAAERALPAP